MDAEWIDQPDALDRWAARRRGAPLLMDTEFVRERTFYPQLGLAQIASDGAVALVDPLPDGTAPALADLLQHSPRVTMHSASEDLEALRHACGHVPTTLFDTQIAATLAGIGGGLSYQRLIEATLDVSLDKSETRTDWLRRPLSAAQLRYAADDVRYLGEAEVVLVERLRALGRLSWAEEDSARLLQTAGADDIDPWPHLSFRPAQRMNRSAQVRLWRLLRWREAQARRSDRPRGWVLDNVLAQRLAERPPARQADFERLLDATPKAPRSQRDVLWQHLTGPLTDTEQTMPLARAFEGADKDRLKAAQQAVAGVAAKLDLPDTALASRRQLEALLAEGQWPDSLSGWRRPLLEPVLAVLLG